MPAQPLSFFARLWLAIVCLFRVVFDPQFAAQVAAVREGAALPPARWEKNPPTIPVTPLAVEESKTETPRAQPQPALEQPATVRAAEALRLLALLQREGRLLDFCEEELAGFSDAQIGAAARTVHAGCRKALHEAVVLTPVRGEREGDPVTVHEGFEVAAVRLTGNVVGNPPFNGVLRHHGWKVTDVKLAVATGDATVLAPAEVELP
jgi:hypothetical protein